MKLRDWASTRSIPLAVEAPGKGTVEEVWLHARPVCANGREAPIPCSCCCMKFKLFSANLPDRKGTAS